MTIIDYHHLLYLDVRSFSIIQSPLALVLHLTLTPTSTQISLSTAVHKLDPARIADSNSDNHLNLNLNAVKPLISLVNRFISAMDIIKATFSSSSSSSSSSSTPSDKMTTTTTTTAIVLNPPEKKRASSKLLFIDVSIHDILLRFEPTPNLVFVAGIRDVSVCLHEGAKRITIDCISHIDYHLDGHSSSLLDDLECK